MEEYHLAEFLSRNIGLRQFELFRHKRVVFSSKNAKAAYNDYERGWFHEWMVYYLSRFT